MKIGIDGNEANVLNKVGVSVYAFELLKYFEQKSCEKLKFIVYLRNEPNKEMPKESKFFTYRIVNGPFAWSQIFLPISLYLRQDVDVFFSPAHYIPRFCPCPVVVTLHDLSYLLYGEEFLQKDLYKLIHWTDFAVKKAHSVIAVSNSTAVDAKQRYKHHANKIQVVHNGFRQSLELVKESRLAPDIKKPYILFVSTLQPRKNLKGLLYAYSKLLRKSPQYQLVVVGKKGWLFDSIFKTVRELGIEKKVIFTGFVSDAELKSLYKNAKLFVVPGLYEGFGYPMLEAMFFNCPVIASNTGALPEVGGDAVLYFDPNNHDEMARTMHNVLTNAKIRSMLIEKGKKQVKKFSWHDCAERTLQIVIDAVKK